MKVKEMIQVLSKLDQDKEIVIEKEEQDDKPLIVAVEAIKAPYDKGWITQYYRIIGNVEG